jgi:hypothetical protein
MRATIPPPLFTRTTTTADAASPCTTHTFHTLNLNCASVVLKFCSIYFRFVTTGIVLGLCLRALAVAQDLVFYQVWALPLCYAFSDDNDMNFATPGLSFLRFLNNSCAQPQLQVSPAQPLGGTAQSHNQFKPSPGCLNHSGDPGTHLDPSGQGFVPFQCSPGAHLCTQTRAQRAHRRAPPSSSPSRTRSPRPHTGGVQGTGVVSQSQVILSGCGSQFFLPEARQITTGLGTPILRCIRDDSKTPSIKTPVGAQANTRQTSRTPPQ